MANISIDVADNEARQDLQDLEDYVDSAAFDKQSLSVSQNGTYTAPAGKAYSPVTVNVAVPAESPTFLITVNDGGYDHRTMDKTYAEITEAFEAGKVLMVYLISEEYGVIPPTRLQLSYTPRTIGGIFNDNFTFANYYLGDGELDVFTVGIYSDGGINVEHQQFTNY